MELELLSGPAQLYCSSRFLCFLYLSVVSWSRLPGRGEQQRNRERLRGLREVRGMLGPELSKGDFGENGKTTIYWNLHETWSLAFLLVTVPTLFSARHQ